MAQLRLAMAQVNPVVGDLAGNARMVRERVAEAAAAGAHLVAFPEMVLTAYPVEDLALRESFVEASRRALVRLAADLATDGYADLPVVVGYLDRADEPGPSSGVRRRPGPHAPAELCGGHPRRQGRRPLREAPPAELRGLRRVPDLRAWRVAHRGPGARRRRGHRHLRGPLAGGRARRPDPRRGCRAAARHQRFPVRAGEGRHAARAGPAAGGTGRVHARLPQHGRRTGRARLRRRLDGGRDRRGGDRPRPAVRRVTGRRGPGDDPVDGRRLGPAGGRGPRRGVLGAARPVCTAGPTDVPAARPGRGGVARRRARAAGLRAQERVPQGPARGVRRDRLDGRGDHRRGRTGRRERRGDQQPEQVLVGGLQGRRRRAGQEPRPGLPGRPDPADGRRRSSRPSDSPESPRRTSRRASGVSSGWASPTRRAHSSSPTPTRARCPSGTRRSTATAWAGSPRSRTCPRPWCGSSPAGATGMRRRAASRPPFRRRRSPSRRRPSCGRARPTRTPCRPTRSSTRFSPATSGWPTGGSGSSPTVSTRRTVDKVIQLVDRAEWKRRQFAPGPKISPLAFGKDRRLPITSRWREVGEDRS